MFLSQNWYVFLQGGINGTTKKKGLKEEEVVCSYIDTETGEIKYSLHEGDSIRVDTREQKEYRENERNKDREFVELFKRNYDEIVKFISLDPKRRIAVDCFTCIKGMDLSKQYGKPKRKE